MKMNPVTAYKLGTRVARILPPWLAYPLCRLGGILIYRFNRKGRAAVRSNMRHVVGPAASQRLVSRLARNVFINNLKNYYDMLRLPYLDHATVRRMVEVKDAHYALDELAKGKGVVLISAHLGNFNLIIQAANALGTQLHLLAEPIEPPELYEYITALRESQGLKLIPVGGPSLRQVFRVLKDGQVLGIATDRDVTNSGEMLPFFGQPTSMPVGAIEIGRRAGAPIIPVLIYRQSNNRSVAQLFSPLALAHTDDPAADSATNKRLLLATHERFIASHPDQWIILQPMWKDNKELGIVLDNVGA
jgi:lauroyl/myristoyl acyltransferase